MKKMKRFFMLSVILLSLGSVSILFMPLSSSYANSTGRLSVALNGAWFWLCMIAGYVMIWLANRERKKQRRPLRGRAGMFRVFSNKYAKIADITALVSLVAFTAVQVFGGSHSYISIVLLFVFVLSIHMHALLNGLIFETLLTKANNKEERTL